MSSLPVLIDRNGTFLFRDARDAEGIAWTIENVIAIAVRVFPATNWNIKRTERRRRAQCSPRRRCFAKCTRARARMALPSETAGLLCLAQKFAAIFNLTPDNTRRKSRPRVRFAGNIYFNRAAATADFAIVARALIFHRDARIFGIFQSVKSDAFSLSLSYLAY